MQRILSSLLCSALLMYRNRRDPPNNDNIWTAHRTVGLSRCELVDSFIIIWGNSLYTPTIQGKGLPV